MYPDPTLRVKKQCAPNQFLAPENNEQGALTKATVTDHCKERWALPSEECYTYAHIVQVSMAVHWSHISAITALLAQNHCASRSKRILRNASHSAQRSTVRFVAALRDIQM